MLFAILSEALPVMANQIESGQGLAIRGRSGRMNKRNLMMIEELIEVHVRLQMRERYGLSAARTHRLMSCDALEMGMQPLNCKTKMNWILRSSTSPHVEKGRVAKPASSWVKFYPSTPI